MFEKQSFIEECELHYECKTVYQQAIEPATFDKNIKSRTNCNISIQLVFLLEILT